MVTAQAAEGEPPGRWGDGHATDVPHLGHVLDVPRLNTLAYIHISKSVKPFSTGYLNLLSIVIYRLQ